MPVRDLRQLHYAGAASGRRTRFARLPRVARFLLHNVRAC